MFFFFLFFPFSVHVLTIKVQSDIRSENILIVIDEPRGSSLNRPYWLDESINVLSTDTPHEGHEGSHLLAVGGEIDVHVLRIQTVPKQTMK